jgi:hypothetical protein
MAVAEATRPQTLGESRVRSSFNPSKDSTVDQIKDMSAKLIDFCANRRGTNPETDRLWALAMTHYEDAAMWAVKAATAAK